MMQRILSFTVGLPIGFVAMAAILIARHIVDAHTSTLAPSTLVCSGFENNRMICNDGTITFADGGTDHAAP